MPIIGKCASCSFLFDTKYGLDCPACKTLDAPNLVIHCSEGPGDGLPTVEEIRAIIRADHMTTRVWKRPIPRFPTGRIPYVPQGNDYITKHWKNWTDDYERRYGASPYNESDGKDIAELDRMYALTEPVPLPPAAKPEEEQ